MGEDKTLDFKTYEEAAEWFDTHDMSDYEDKLRPARNASQREAGGDCGIEEFRNLGVDK